MTISKQNKAIPAFQVVCVCVCVCVCAQVRVCVCESEMWLVMDLWVAVKRARVGDTERSFLFLPVCHRCTHRLTHLDLQQR